MPDPCTIALHYDKIMWDELMDAPGEIFDTAARDAALDALIEDALFDGEETALMDDERSVLRAIDEAL
jgi:hypothetical protein